MKDHPAILMWVVGNEWNYNGLYTDMGVNAARDRRDVVDLIKEMIVDPL